MLDGVAAVEGVGRPFFWKVAVASLGLTGLK
ncbi:Hypothetical protein NGAL_HAMBI2427_41080 [Neorhizobium galegae bv. orientalis]|uniref:Uncharacterized protein n=2 Tax=Neorhizobium galegae TaxID=399 RepID=A0A068SRT6_NEOGA|nr:Hypothetical protein RG540_CH16130 [Neorhizobium galegae bv. orientalis str. HAMBI 540]CDN53912.1 Hypothetical protein RG1141_CH15690 [Neorhizobium galegae bv. officinalis bv. officinalis str. HAMBI 1141]CDZ51330.1 Hypothetical protein NGAL_HAMBI2427_41080 [Neorhizobium galegae bv. orientalis]